MTGNVFATRLPARHRLKALRRLIILSTFGGSLAILLAAALILAGLQ